MPGAEDLSEEERRRLLKTPVFARFSPAQKLDLIQIYQDAGYVVAMTGDGVNDAPALKKADIGVAMGQRGTEVARDAADMVLLDDSFATIVAAVRQGRSIFGNIRRFVLYMLSGNTGEIFAVSLVAFLNAPLPLLPLQILYINIVSDVFPALALGVGESSGDVMKRPPRDPREPILTRRIWGVIGGYGALIGGSVLAVFFYAFELGMSTYEAVTVSFLTFGFARLWHVFNMRDASSPVFRNEITTNRYVWLAVGIGVALMLAAVYLPVLGPVLGTVPPDAEGWALIAGGSLAPLIVAQVLKLPGLRRLISRLLELVRGGGPSARLSRDAEGDGTKVGRGIAASVLAKLLFAGAAVLAWPADAVSAVDGSAGSLGATPPELNVMLASEVNLAALAIGATVLVASMFSSWLRQRWITDPMACMSIGVLIGPVGLQVFEPVQWPDQAKLIEVIARATLVLSLMAVALHLPRRWIVERWRPTVIFLLAAMTLMWGASTAVIALVLKVDLTTALLLGAIVTPTDPVLATAIVTGPVAERSIPARLRNLLHMESAANDGPALAFVMLPVLLLTASGGSAMREWLLGVIGWQVLAASIIGAAAGWLAGRLQRLSERYALAQYESLVAITLSLAIAIGGGIRALDGDGFLAVFVAALCFRLIIPEDSLLRAEEHVQQAVQRLAQLPIFILFGMMLPWTDWAELGWRAPAVVAGLLVLRRMPALLLLKPAVEPIRHWSEALFCGWFGPIGISALFYAALAQGHLAIPEVWDPDEPHRRLLDRPPRAERHSLGRPAEGAQCRRARARRRRPRPERRLRRPSMNHRERRHQNQYLLDRVSDRSPGPTRSVWGRISFADTSIDPDDHRCGHFSRIVQLPFRVDRRKVSATPDVPSTSPYGMGGAWTPYWTASRVARCAARAAPSAPTPPRGRPGRPFCDVSPTLRC